MMQNNRFQELKRLNSQQRLKKALILIDSRFSHSTITNVSIDYRELVQVSEKHITKNIRADGCRVNHIYDILSLFKILITKYIEQNGDSAFKMMVPFDGYDFELSVFLNWMVDNYEKITDTFFKIDDNTSQEILIYKEDEQAGLCLLSEEHRYFIAIW